MSTKARVYSLALLLLLAECVIAANTVSWSAGSPTSGTGSIKGQGTYAADTGWTANNPVMSVIPTGGGMIETALGTLGAGSTWGPIEITGLAKGQYTVNVTIIFKKPGEKEQAIAAPVAIISVP